LKLKTKFLILIVVALSISATLVTVVELYSMYNQASRENENNLRNQAVQLASQVDTWFTGFKQAGQALAGQPVLLQGTADDIQQSLMAVQKSIPGISNLSVIRRDGVLTYAYPYNPKLVGTSMADRDYFKAVLTTKESFTTEVMVSRNSGKQVVIIAHPIKDKNNEVQGVLVQGVDLELLQDMVNKIRVGQTGVAAVTTPTGKFIAHTNEQAVADGQSLSEGMLALSQKNSQEVKQDTTASGSSNLGTAARIEATGWFIAVEVPVSELMSGFYSSVKYGLGTFLVILLICSVGVIFICNRLFRPLAVINEQAAKLGEGDLNTAFICQSRDELGQLATTMDDAISKLRDILRTVYNHSQNLLSASKELASTSDEVERAVQQIAVNTNEVAAGTQEVGGRILDAANRTDEVTKLTQVTALEMQNLFHNAETIEKVVQQGQGMIDQATQVINGIAESTNGNVNLVSKLSEKSQQVNDIVAMINTVAHQTNLLALNAAIEAARAGEHGRGFAVVADEVRKLAEQSQHSAEEISRIIKEMVADISNVVSVFQNTSKAMDEGVNTMGQANSSFADIAGHIQATLAKIQEVGSLTEQQENAINDLKTIIHSVAALSQQSAAATQSSAASNEQISASVENVAFSAQTLSTLADKLQQAVTRFKF
jgi:methyl-accepting chemotaxis protein